MRLAPFRNLKFLKFLTALVFLTGLAAWGLQPAFASEGNIDSTNKYAWNENVGWQNFRPTHGGATVEDSGVYGYVWLENIGWVRLAYDSNPPYENTSSTNWGVNNDGSGNLSGYAWSENTGWINFNPTHSQVTVSTSTGEFDGYAWSENLGWIHFKNASCLQRYDVLALFINNLKECRRHSGLRDLGPWLG